MAYLRTNIFERFALDRQPPNLWTLFRWFRLVLGPEAGYFWLAVIYGIAISLLSLALPISVQMLIDTVANTALIQPVVVLASVLFGLLLLSGILVALRTHLMELFARRLYARLTAEIAVRAVHAHASYFEEGKRDSLFNRYFDIMTLQSNVPSLLTGAFTLLFQATIGFIVVSLYHPYFLLFTILVITVMFLIWIIWGPGAIRTAIEESYAKYETAHDLEGLAENNNFYHSERHIDAGLLQINARVTSYIESNRQHFRRSFSQTVSLLILYAVGSAALLGIGGLLVIQGQLTLGQLVAAELIMSAVLFGLSQFGFYLDQFYETCAAVDKLSAFFRIPQEPQSGELDPPTGPADLEFCASVVKRSDGQKISIDLGIPSGSNVVVRACSLSAQRAFLDLLQGFLRPESGWVRLGGIDILDIHAQRLRGQMFVLDRPDIVECTIDTYLDLSRARADRAGKAEMLRATGLEPTIQRLAKGLDTPIIPSGFPLAQSEVLRLKIAGALLAHPKILVMTQLYDLVERRFMDPVIERISKDKEITFIRFTDYNPLPCDDYEVIMETDEQRKIPLKDGKPVEGMMP